MTSRPASYSHARGLPRTQAGMTLLSLLVLLCGVALLGIGAFRLIPVYISDYKITGALKSVQSEFDGRSASPAELRQALYKRFNIEMINVIKARDVKVKRDKNEYMMTAQYEHEVPYLANIYLRVKFNHEVPVRFGR
jgi:hypothetical protein